MIISPQITPSHLLLLLLSFFTATSYSSDPNEEFIIAGYFPEYRSYIDLKAASLHLTDLILFSISPKSNGSLSNCCLNRSHFRHAREARKYKQTMEGPDAKPLRLLVSIGGAGRSDGFVSIVDDASRRQRFLEELEALCLKEQLDGIDFDWEQPQTQHQFQSYLRLLSEAKAFFQNSNLLVTLALHPHQSLPPQAYKFVHRIHLMTYDMISSRGKRHYSHHASFDQVQNVLKSHNAPKQKVVLGIPMYGRHFQNPSDVMTYSELVDHLTKTRDDFTLHDLIHQKGNNNLINGYHFDTPMDVQRKVSLARKNELGGVFFWEIGQDSFFVKGGVLLKVAADVVKNGTISVDEMVDEL